MQKRKILLKNTHFKIPSWILLICFTSQVSFCQNTHENKPTNKIAPISSSNPLQYEALTSKGQMAFESMESTRLKVKLIPNNGRRKQLGIKTISGIQGVTHFFLDHDLTTGYIHPFTLNFFLMLRPNDYVLKFERTERDSSTGYIQYIRKNQMAANDKLGINIAFFRQWKLSEIDYRGSGSQLEIHCKASTYKTNAICPQAKSHTTNPFAQNILQIPIWSQFKQSGYVSLGKLNTLDNLNGGTVVIIWEDQKTGQIKFKDIHGSISKIVNSAIEISKKYAVDPVIAIGDAGPMAIKIKSNENMVLDCTKIPLEKLNRAGAGFGYMAME